MIVRYKVSTDECSDDNGYCWLKVSRNKSGDWVKYADAETIIKEAYENGKKEGARQARVEAQARQWGKEKY